MRPVVLLSLLLVAVVGSTQAQSSATWVSVAVHDARPEAIMTGSALFVLASLLRRGVTGRRAK